MRNNYDSPVGFVSDSAIRISSDGRIRSDPVSNSWIWPNGIRLFYSLIGMHTLTIDKLLEQYEQDVEQIKYEFRQERAKIIRDHDISKTELQDIIYNMEKSFLDAETAAEQNFQANMEELRNKVC